MTIVYLLKIKYDQDKVGGFFRHIQHDKLPFGDKHFVNAHHVIRKSHDATQEKCLYVVHFNVPCD